MARQVSCERLLASAIARSARPQQPADQFRRVERGLVSEMHVALRAVGAAVAEQTRDHRRILLLDRGMAGEAVAQVVQAQRRDFCQRQDDVVPERQQLGEGLTGAARAQKHPRTARHARHATERFLRRRADIDLARTGLTIAQRHQPAGNVAPAQRQDLALAAAGVEQQPDRADAGRIAVLQFVERAPEAAQLLLGQVAAEHPTGILGDAAAWVGVRRHLAPVLSLDEHRAEDVERAVGGSGPDLAHAREPLEHGHLVDLVEESLPNAGSRWVRIYMSWVSNRRRLHRVTPYRRNALAKSMNSGVVFASRLAFSGSRRTLASRISSCAFARAAVSVTVGGPPRLMRDTTPLIRVNTIHVRRPLPDTRSPNPGSASSTRLGRFRSAARFLED